MTLIQVIDDGDGADDRGADITESVVRRTASLSLNGQANSGVAPPQSFPRVPTTGITQIPSGIDNAGGNSGGVTRSIETHLAACRTAALSNDVSGLASALDSLRDELLLLDEAKGRYHTARYNTALSLIRIAPVTTCNAEPDRPAAIKSKLEQCLDICGSSNAFLAATNLLRGDAAATGTNDCNVDEPSSTSSVVYAIQTARRALFGSSETDNTGTKSSSLGNLCQDYALAFGTPLSQEQSMRDLTDRAILLPVGIGSACHRSQLQYPSWAIRERYCKRLVEVAIEAAALALNVKSSKREGGSAEESFLAFVLEKMSHHGASDPAVLGLHRFWSRQLNEGGAGATGPIESCDVLAFSSIVVRAVTKISPHRDAAVLLRSMVRFAASKLDAEQIGLLQQKTKHPTIPESHWSLRPMLFLRHVCLPPLQSSDSICDHFFRLVIMSPSPSESLSVAGAQESDVDARWIVTPCIVSLILLDLSGECLLQYLRDASETWAETIFVQMTDQSQQLYVTEFIEASLPLLDKDKADADMYQSTVLALVQGVTARLESSNVLIRRQGMRVAELLAPSLGQELHFAELDGHRRSDVKKKENDLKPTTASIEERSGAKGGISNGNGSTFNADDDDDDDDDDDSVWSDEDLVPYNLEDDEEDLAAVKRPRYLRDCLQLFRTPSDDKCAYDAIQAALTAVAPLVESNPPDLPDLALPLTKELLHAEDKFHMKDFASLRWDGLCALLVHEPVSIANLLVETITDGSPFGVRLDILGLFEYGADRLCGAAKLRDNRAIRKKLAAEQNDTKPKVSGKRKLVPYESKEKTTVCSKNQVDILEQKTRRWGKGRQNSKQPSETNRFGQIAPMWFYQLVSAWIQTKDNISIWGGSNGSKFFANYLVALAKIVECSGNHPGTSVLALDLFQLAMPFRHADSSEIRMAVLVTIATCCPFLPAEAFSTSHDGEDFSTYLARAALRDTDASCRQIAGIIGQNMTSIDTLRLR